jgi:hypothetical protein
LADNDTYDEILEDIYNGKENNEKEIKDFVVHDKIVKGYKENFLHGVNQVLNSSKYDSKYYNLQKQLESNVSRFSYYKAYKATSLIKQYKKETKNKKEYMSVGRAILNTFNRYQATEYNTTVARSRTAKQWSDFTSDETNQRLFPNLKWIPSRSSHPREAHKPFYDHVWAKDDPFWLSNQPGSLWNCKCDWQETSEPITDGNPTSHLSAPGLKGNPAITGKIFSDDASYFKSGNNKQLKEIEKICEISYSNELSKEEKPIISKQTTKCTIKGVSKNVIFIPKGIDHAYHDMICDKNFWLKNSILTNIKDYVKTAKYIGKKVSDTKHNTRKETLKLKNNTDFFYYFEITLPNKDVIYLHLGCYKKGHIKAGQLYLYSIGANRPNI